MLLTGGRGLAVPHVGARPRTDELDWTSQPEGTEPTVDPGRRHLAVVAGRDRARRVPAGAASTPCSRSPCGPRPGRTPRGAAPPRPPSCGRASARWRPPTPTPGSSRPSPPTRSPRPTPDNRMIGYPYTKLMNSNNMVEQGAGLILCSVEAARSLGVPSDRWVFPQAGTDAHDHWFVSNRADLCSSPAIRLAGGRALELAGVGVDDLAHVDLYSCFPSAVQIAAAELGLDHRAAAHRHRRHELRRRAVEQLPDARHRHHGRPAARRARGRRAVHAPTAATPPSTPSASTRPPRRPAGFRHDDLQAAVDATPGPDARPTDHVGPVHGRELHRDARPRRRARDAACSPCSPPTAAGRGARPTSPTRWTSSMATECVGPRRRSSTPTATSTWSDLGRAGLGHPSGGGSGVGAQPGGQGLHDPVVRLGHLLEQLLEVPWCRTR